MNPRLESPLAQAVLDTVPEPFLVLDDKCKVLFASRSFCHAFHVSDADFIGSSVYDVVGARLEIPAFRELLETIIPTHSTVEKYEIEGEFPSIGKRTLILSAREVFFEDGGSKKILVALEDATDRRVIEEKNKQLLANVNELLKQKDTLLEELQHRVFNSLQIIASILLLKARTATSEEARLELENAHRRVMSVASVQRHIHAAGSAKLIDMAPYLTKLCDSLAQSMTGGDDDVSVRVISDEAMVDSRQAVSVGLIVTELVINALKYAFPKGRSRPNGEVLVRYEVSGTNWRLVIADNGVGKEVGKTTPVRAGLGTTLVAALVNQLGAKLETVNSRDGFKASVTFSTFDPHHSHPDAS